MSQPLQGKCIVVVGGTSGLGLSACKACAAAGASVATFGLGADSVSRAREELGDGAIVLEGDATAPGAAGDLIEGARKRFGSFDGLYHVAGGSGRKWGDGPLHEVSDEGWDRTIRLNQSSVFYSNRAAIAAFLEAGGGGAIVNVASVLAFSPSPEHFGTHAYAAAKAAIIGMTKSAAAYYAPENIRINAVAPGLVDTPMAGRAAGDETIMGFVSAKQPLDGGRIGRPTDLDGAVVFLLSDAASYVTGQVLSVDGGWSVSEGVVSG